MRARLMYWFLGTASVTMEAVLTLGAAAPPTPKQIPKTGYLIESEPNGPVPLEQRRSWADYVSRQFRSAPFPSGPSGGNGVEVIYGADNRKDIYAVSDSGVHVVARAVCAVVDQTEIKNNHDGTYTLKASPWTSEGGFPLCAGERFVGQLQLGFCTGFLVGPDLLATAGHCVNLSTCGSTAFVFGFEQIDSLTPPPLVVPASNVYFCAGIVDQQQSGDYDHCILRLDRPVVGRDPLDIRRTGSVANGDPLYVVGHGIVLPTKAADGANVQNANGTIPWFQANLDTYGGNSGSPVMGINSQVVEGILVRGATDFVLVNGCMRSNVVPNTGSPQPGLPFEEASKTITFAADVPVLVFSKGRIRLGRSVYSCSSVIQVEMRDLDLRGSVSHSVELTSSAGDSEAVALTETPDSSGIFIGSILAAGGAPLPGDGLLEVANGQTITAIYHDANDGTGVPAVATATASVDCLAPSISNVTIFNIMGTRATVGFDTDEPASGIGRYGTACGSLLQSQNDPGGITAHAIILSGLTPLTPYFLALDAVDPAGNLGTNNNGGLCFMFTTVSQPDYFTELFSTNNDLHNKMVAFTPDGSGDFYAACDRPAAIFPTDTAGGVKLTLSDDDFVGVDLAGGAQVHLYGVGYSRFYVGSNGYITFGSGDASWAESLSVHFRKPRISALFDDLSPNQGGMISYKQLADRMAVSFVNVPEYRTTDSNSFQIEMFFDGKIAITYLNIAAVDGLAGLSAGSGVPADFVQSDLSAYSPCPCSAQLDCPCHGDPQCDGVTDVFDVIKTVDVAFRGAPPIIDTSCPHSPGGRTDVDCSGATDVFDVIKVVDVAFRSVPKNFCNPCACNPYPTNCPR